MKHKQHDPLTHRYARTLDEAFDERGPLVEIDAKPKMSTALKYVAAIWLVFTVVIGYELTGMAFTQGFEQGYVEGRERALMTEQQVLLQCTQWWFGEGNPRAMQTINQYCDRR